MATWRRTLHLPAAHNRIQCQITLVGLGQRSYSSILSPHFLGTSPPVAMGYEHKQPPHLPWFCMDIGPAWFFMYARPGSRWWWPWGRRHSPLRWCGSSATCPVWPFSTGWNHVGSKRGHQHLFGKAFSASIGTWWNVKESKMISQDLPAQLWLFPS